MKETFLIDGKRVLVNEKWIHYPLYRLWVSKQYVRLFLVLLLIPFILILTPFVWIAEFIINHGEYLFDSVSQYRKIINE